MLRRLLSLLLALTFTLLAVRAQAQVPSPPSGKPSAADEAAAKKNFESGLKLFGEGAYAEALIAFEQSYRIGGRPSALKNAAQCQRNLKHFVEAYEDYEQLLTAHEAQLSAADKQAVRQALDELGVLTGTIEVAVNETGADIDIDGRNVARSPMTKPKRVRVEAHVVKVSKPGFTPVEQTVTVGSQEQKKLDVKLEAERSTAHVTVREQAGRDVHVFVDAKDVGAAPWEGELEAGDHVIEAKGPRFASEARKVHVVAKERLDVALDAIALTGHLRVTTVPATATIRVDGNPVGTGAWEGDLPEGTHRIEVALEGQPPQVRDVLLGRGQLVVQEIPLVGAIASGVADYTGFYGRFAIAFAFAAAGPADNSSAAVSSEGGFSFNATAALRLGYAWDWYGAEVVGLFALDHREAKYRYEPTAYELKDESTSPAFFVGAGGRATSKNDTIRFTFGMAPGISVRTFSPERHQTNGGNSSQPNNTGNGGTARFGSPQTTTNGPTTSGSQDQTFANAGYTTFGVLFDGGILLGSSPGTKFYLGLQALVDFAPTIVTGPDTLSPIPDAAFPHPGRGVGLVDGVQFFVGPTLGLQFGH
jgi:tetratricopeptide (TPR) repeat protein